MKTFKFLSLIVFSTVFIACGGNANKKTNESKTTDQSQIVAENNVNRKELVEVLIFHGVKQCETCEAIKKNTKEVVDQKFQNQVKNNEVVFKIIDFSKPENKEIAEKYEIAWTSVVLVKHTTDGKEVVENISKFAIENARTNTDEYKKVLAEDIYKLLN